MGTSEHNEVLTSAAEDYLQRGLRIIALTGKAPNVSVHRRGLYDALSGAQAVGRLREVFCHRDTTGIGILTDDPYYVVDIDGEEGAKAWATIMGGIDIPKSWVARTGRGLHLWYAHSSSWCECGYTFRTAKLGEKLDFKGAGGYVAAPPSLHPDGHTYEWLLAPEDGPPWEMPESLHSILLTQERMKEQRQITAVNSKRERHRILEDGMIYNTFSFDGLINAVRTATSGNRNATLHWAACCMAEDGATPEEYAELSDAAAAVGLGRRETILTIRSAQKRVGA